MSHIRENYLSGLVHTRQGLQYWAIDLDKGAKEKKLLEFP